MEQRPALPPPNAVELAAVCSTPFIKACFIWNSIIDQSQTRERGRTAATMDHAVRSSPSALVFGLILLAPGFTTGFVAPRVPFLRAERIAAAPSLARDRVNLQTRTTRATQGVRSRTAAPTQNPVACAMAGRNEGKALACMRPWSQQPSLPHYG